MKRHAFMLDLLRPGITISELTEWISCKQELTQEDLEEIMVSAEKIIAAVVITKMNQQVVQTERES